MAFAQTGKKKTSQQRTEEKTRKLEDGEEKGGIVPVTNVTIKVLFADQDFLAVKKSSRWGAELRSRGKGKGRASLPKTASARAWLAGISYTPSRETRSVCQKGVVIRTFMREREVKENRKRLSYVCREPC